MLGYSITDITDFVLFIACIFILIGSVFISIKTNFIQIRFIPSLFKTFFGAVFRKNQLETQDDTIQPHKALLTAMSTTVGISTIVGPFIAISLGGPGALLGFLLTSFFGSAATYTEVSLCITHRKKHEDGKISGGPMQYLSHLISPACANWYAIGCFILMAAWSSAQANQLAAILNSPLLEDYRVSPLITGSVVAILVILTLIGGIKRISELSSKLVPSMFFIYLGACFWIIFNNLEKLPDVFYMIFQSIQSPYALASGSVIGGVVAGLRWGVFKGIQTCEAGIGTQTIPHTMAKTEDPVAQGTLAMLSTYTAGCVAFLSGMVALITETWLDPNLPLGISMVAASFEQYFSTFGVIIVVVSAFLFVFGTILGNSYNGCQCFHYLTEHTKTKYYLVFTALMIFLGSIAEVRVVWSLVDIVLAAIALPHMSALVLHTWRSTSKKRACVPVEEAS